ncbi:putative protein S-acyltransferase 3 [Camellia lanceoleosa]|uniref:Uncharacterized protein n=1 Tax=Camellia lanceoleosa TaxID=1840588 RepID=A0ACC0GCJ2_9ERIC|nr:putative protein S-acyltransferase 3 [Camellia lanceoleosa]
MDLDILNLDVDNQPISFSMQTNVGSNRNFCGGRLSFGPHVVSLFLSTFLIEGPALAFCIKIYSNITESKGKDWYVVVGSILTILDKPQQPIEGRLPDAIKELV